MVKKLTFGDLRRLLLKSGFERKRVQGPYVFFEHPDADVWQAFRSHRVSEIVDPMTVASVRKTLVGFGFMEEEDFETAVRQAAAKPKAKARR